MFVNHYVYKHLKNSLLKKDPTAESRKKDHIELAFQSQVLSHLVDPRFYYEPILAGHPTSDTDIGIDILGKHFATPIWVSSMTGGTEKAKTININLAKACKEYGMGMGLGSCRSLLDSNERMSDFDMRSYIGDQPLYANLGVAQIEELIDVNQIELIPELVKKLQADGLIIHVNPLQEWLQPEGDRYRMSPLTMIQRLIDAYPELAIIVKEVGQGMGPKSLETLYSLPIVAVDFAASGGTNFAKLELHRAEQKVRDIHNELAHVGHTAHDMVEITNAIIKKTGSQVETIISGGITSYLDGYYTTEKLNGNAIYGQASAFLRNAMGDYEDLQAYVETQINGLKIAKQFLTIRQ